jgi:hypothetical protein
MYPLTTEELFVLARLHFAGHPELALLDREDASVPPREGMAILNALFDGLERMFLLNTRYEIGAGLLVSELIGGTLASGAERDVLLREYCIFGYHLGAAGFCPFSTSGDVRAMRPTWRRIAAGLAGDAVPDPLSLSLLAPNLIGSEPIRTFAALTVGETPEGGKVTHFHRHPKLPRGQAAALLKDCIFTLMTGVEA